MIKSLNISFDREEGNRVFFKTEAGQKLSVAKDLLPDDFDKDQKFYLTLDNQPITSGGGREILNDLLDPDN